MQPLESSLVMKFGGAALAEPAGFERVVDIIAAKQVIFKNIAIVVSAMGNTTDELFGLALKINPDPPRRELDMLVTAGERISVALLAMALAKRGIKAKSFTGSQSGIVTNSLHNDAKIINVLPHRLYKAFAEGNVVIVAGYQGVSVDGEITTLGRGGSDTSAVAIAAAFGTKTLEFYKNVSGVFNQDPRVNVQATKFSKMTYSEAYNLVITGCKILHPRCIKLAENNGITLHVKSFLDPEDPGTEIGHVEFRMRPPSYEVSGLND